MSFLAGLGPAATAIGSASGLVAPAANAVKPNWAASGLGKLLGADPGKISSIADSIGGGMNKIAAAGGAQEGYAPAPELPSYSNHMQLLDPAIIRALLQQFGGQR